MSKEREKQKAGLERIAEKIAARTAWDTEGPQFQCFKREALEVLRRNLPLLREVLK